MSGRRLITVAVVGITVSVAVLGAISYGLRDTANGRLAFRVWRAISPEVQGGHFIAVNDIQVYYETYGRGPPVLVLHGGLGSIEDMGHQIRALASTRLVIAPDSRGHGRSSDSPAPLSYRLMADDMVKLLEALELRQLDVVGWSDGGIIGLEIAMRHPERVGRLVVIGANFDTDGLKQPPPAANAPPRPSFLRRNTSAPTRWDALYEKVVAMWQTQPHYSIESLGRIKAATLVMAGEFDVIRPEHTDQLARPSRAPRRSLSKAALILCRQRRPISSMPISCSSWQGDSRDLGPASYRTAAIVSTHAVYRGTGFDYELYWLFSCDYQGC